MSKDVQAVDFEAIKALITRQFGSLNWGSGRSADWGAFGADFLDAATLVPSVRPAERWTVPRFVERMKHLSTSTLQSFEERVLGSQVLVFGNVAVAMAACENLENGSEVTRNVEAMLLVKDGGDWRIVAQAWDAASDEKPIPRYLIE